MEKINYRLDEEKLPSYSTIKAATERKALRRYPCYI